MSKLHPAQTFFLSTKPSQTQNSNCARFSGLKHMANSALINAYFLQQFLFRSNSEAQNFTTFSSHFLL